MDISALSNSVSSIFTENKAEIKGSITPYEAQSSFASVLKESISEINNAQQASSEITQKLALGHDVSLEDVMITAQKASITLEAAIQFRNKAIEAYQEMMRISM